MPGGLVTMLPVSPTFCLFVATINQIRGSIYFGSQKEGFLVQIYKGVKFVRPLRSLRSLAASIIYSKKIMTKMVATVIVIINDIDGEKLLC